MTCGIYEIKNKEEDRVYIGQSVDIESRWKAHMYMNPLNTNKNLKPTLELANNIPELVEFNILMSFNDELYSKEEMKFILSIHEKHELDLRGGPTSDKTINVMPINIPEVNPSLFLKYSLPDFVDDKDVLNSVFSWAKTQRRKQMWEPDYKEMYLEESQKNYQLSNRLSELEEETSPKQKMSQEYEVFKLKQKISQLEDEKEELQERVTFWKKRCNYWRAINGE